MCSFLLKFAVLLVKFLRMGKSVTTVLTLYNINTSAIVAVREGIGNGNSAIPKLQTSGIVS
jgi:hypothetical protein